MKVFHCDHCRNLVFFENVRCVSCDHPLAFLPDLGVVGSLDPAPEQPGTWMSPLPRGGGHRYKLCRNYLSENVCNWAVAADDPDDLCRACRLTRVIPDLSREKNVVAWYKLEVAKRRLVYTLNALGLPIKTKAEDPAGGLAFEFRADPDVPGGPKVLTGHDEGLITINLAEADDAERELRRTQLGEPYRTLLGHMRHEVGHYYWDRLVRDDPARLAAFRDLFGDDRASYDEALKRHYRDGPPADWSKRFVSTYASSHAWEDWAETWAHYLHMVDVLETAAACGVSLRPNRPEDPSLPAVPDPVEGHPEPFDALMASWFPVTYLLNNLNRGMGLPDGYPFVLPPAAVEKLRFVHETVAGKKC